MPIAVITGGAGFIGSHIATSLVDDGWSVRVVDNLSTGKRDNLRHLASRVELLEGDVRDRVVLDRAMAGAEVVFHQAAMVSVPMSVEKPMECHEICATGTMNVLLAAQQAKVRRVVYAASSSCYGDASPCPIDEQAALAPMSPYAAAKLAGEHYCAAASAVNNLETVRLRYFNVFGPRQDPKSPYSGVISIFCSKMLSNQAPMLHGDGLQTRDFVYVANVVRANRLAAERPGIAGRVFNIGCGDKITLLQLLEGINTVLGKRLVPTFGPARVGDVRHSQANITAARQLLSYDPAVSFLDGLRATVEYYSQLQ